MTRFKKLKIDIAIWLACFIFPKLTSATSHAWEELTSLRRENEKISETLAEAYRVLDRIALRDDSHPKELSQMAEGFINRHKLTIKYYSENRPLYN